MTAVMRDAEARRTADTDATVDALVEKLQADATTPPPADRIADQRTKLRDLVQQRQEQLDSALEANGIYLGKLHPMMYWAGANGMMVGRSWQAFDYLLIGMMWINETEINTPAAKLIK